jgi:DNA end-binding protein Ku
MEPSTRGNCRQEEPFELHDCGATMPARASWKGFLRINQLSIPVKAFTACKTEPEIELHQLHRECLQRIKQQKICPVHGVLQADDLVSGYQYTEGQCLSLDAADLEGLLPTDDKAIAVDCFISGGKIDAVHHSGRTYYLVPDEPQGQRPFCVLRDGMRQTDRHAIARVVIGRREILVLLRPLGRLVAMTVLEYPQRVRPVEEYEGEVAGHTAGPAEQELIRQLIDSMSDDNLELSRYQDPYLEGLNHLIEQRLAKIEPVVNRGSVTETSDDAELIAALRASLAEAADHGAPAIPQRRTRRSPNEDHERVRKLG